MEEADFAASTAFKISVSSLQNYAVFMAHAFKQHASACCFYAKKHVGLRHGMPNKQKLEFFC